MITFWVNREGAFGVQNYRSHRGRAIADRFEARVYEDIAGDGVSCSAGPQIFAGLDQVTPAQRELVGVLWDAHAAAAPHAPRLNDPRRALLRFELLQRLWEEGLNTFRVYRTDQADQVTRFPVFVRHIHRHNGPATRIVETPDELRWMLRALRIRGRRMSDHMIVEYCDVSGPDRLFRKYAAFKVGRHIIPSHVFASPTWIVKSTQNEPTEASVQEGLQFQRENPHAAWLAKVFEIAGIDYGRVDYGVAAGVPQVWEINLNATLGRAEGQSRHTQLPPALKALRDSGRDIFHAQLRAAFLELDLRPAEGRVEVHIASALQARLRREADELRRRQRVAGWLRRLYDAPLLNRPVRKLYSLLPRR
ncbi:MAG TPA: hypothetical protein VGQ37_23980 [Vicinamibacterales bacterium]|nr:hypothetical protein [Vicinamibacterales bacterium]